MKSILATWVFLAVIYLGQTGPIVVNNVYTELVANYLDMTRHLYLKKDPYKLPDIINATVRSATGHAVTISLTNMWMGKISTMQITKTETPPGSNTTYFAFKFPELTIKANYEANGTGRHGIIKGKGHLSVHLSKFTRTGEVTFEDIDDFVQITSLKLDYSLKAIKVKVTELSLGNLTQSEVQEKMSKISPSDLYALKPQTEGLMSAKLMVKLNDYLAGRSAKEAANIFKKAVTLGYV